MFIPMWALPALAAAFLAILYVSSEIIWRAAQRHGERIGRAHLEIEQVAHELRDALASINGP